MKKIYICFHLILFLVSASVIISSCGNTTQPTDVELLSSIENAFVSVAKRSTPAIVGVSAERWVEGKQFHQEGSGFIFRKDGYIFTNEHVVKGASAIKIELLGGSEFDAKLAGADPNTDIAVLKINTKEELPVLGLADSEQVQVGQFAIAIGNPFQLNHTVTTGIVSGKGRSILSDRGIIRYQDYIQTDAWINTGNSGGPLLNIHGEVIGINALIRRRDDDAPATQAVRAGAGFAISSNLVGKIGTQLIINGRIIRGFLGIRMLEAVQGIRVLGVLPNMPAHLGGLKRNDIIVKYNGQKVSNVNEFKMWIADSQVGKNSQITVLRDGHERMFAVTIAEMPSLQAGRPVESNSVAWKRLGVSVRKLEKGDSERYTYLTEEDRGVIVDYVQENSPIRQGSLIIAVNGQKVSSAQDFDALLQKMEVKLEPITLDVKSRRGIEQVTVKLSD
jgi:serine protease Do/serine protease DegQ